MADIQQYKDAVWDFLLEHCDVLPSGSLFFKFHAKGRMDIEKRIYARQKGYHREDVKAKCEDHEVKREVFVEKKETKKINYLKDKEERRAKQKKIKETLEQVKKLNDGTDIKSKIKQFFKIT